MAKTSFAGPVCAGYANNGTKDPSKGYIILAQPFAVSTNWPDLTPGTSPWANTAAGSSNGLFGPSNGIAANTTVGNYSNNSTGLVQTATIKLPVNAEILDFIIDVNVAYDSATSATLTIGQSAGGTEYVSGVNAKTTGRASPTITNTQGGNMRNIGTNTTVYLTVTSVGAPTVGDITVICRYIQW